MRGVLLEIFKRTPFFGFILSYILSGNIISSSLLLIKLLYYSKKQISFCCLQKLIFVVCKKRVLLHFKCSPFALRKESFCPPKRLLLQCKTTPFLSHCNLGWIIRAF